MENIPIIPLPNKNDIQHFFANTIANDVHLVAFFGNRSSAANFGDDYAEAAKFAYEANAKGANVYWTVNQVRPDCHKKSTKQDVIGVRFVHLDVDPPKDGGPFDKAAILRRLSDLEAPPSVVVDSGNGIQAFWRIDGSSSSEDVEAFNRAVRDRFGGDNVQNIDRVMRVPGTVNWPNEAKKARGCTPRLSSVLQEDTGTVCNIDELRRVFQPVSWQEEAQSEAFGAEVAVAHAPLLNASDLGLGQDDALRILIENPRGEDKSKDTLWFSVEAFKRGLSPEQIYGVLMNAENAVSAHCLSQAGRGMPERAAKRAIARAAEETSALRRLTQRQENQEIAGGKFDQPPTAKLWTLEAMLNECVFIADGSRVADLSRPRSSLPIADFRNQTAASTMLTTARGAKGSTRVTKAQVAHVWLNHEMRKTVETVTFEPGGGQFALSPDGRESLNIWTGFPAFPEPEDWAQRVEPFLDQVQWLFGKETEPFLDWLAHLVQRPGVLPSYGFLHIAPNQGMGRNWIATILVRVLGIYVEPGFNLTASLKDGFTGRLAGKLLAIVDEIDAGAERFKVAQELKKIVTEERRLINVKFGRQHVERNAVRWLVFSNSNSALPLEDGDRRFYVSRCDERPKSATYYSKLYSLKDDPAFLGSVSRLLRERDISSFRPGAIPPMNAAKAAMIDRVRTDSERILRRVGADWPVEVITSHEIETLLGEDRPRGTALRYELDRAGLVKLGDWKDKATRRRVNSYAVRNAQLWASASLAAVKVEAERLPFARKEDALFGGNMEGDDDFLF